MSNVNDIKHKKRSQQPITPPQALTEPVQSENDQNEKSKEDSFMETKVERKRVSFDFNTSLHKRLKMQAILEERNIYEIIEEAVQNYLEDE